MPANSRWDLIQRLKGLRDNYYGHFISCRVISNTNFLRLDPFLSSYMKDVNVGSKELFSLVSGYCMHFVLSVTHPCIFLFIRYSECDLAG